MKIVWLNQRIERSQAISFHEDVVILKNLQGDSKEPNMNIEHFSIAMVVRTIQKLLKRKCIQVSAPFV